MPLDYSQASTEILLILNCGVKTFALLCQNLTKSNVSFLNFLALQNTSFYGNNAHLNGIEVQCSKFEKYVFWGN